VSLAEIPDGESAPTQGRSSVIPGHGPYHPVVLSPLSLHFAYPVESHLGRFGTITVRQFWMDGESID
jgi:hypothetical protein